MNNASSAQALAPGEARMTLRVIKKDGTEQAHEGQPVTVSLPAELVAEYRAVVKRMREIEEQLLQYAMKGN